MAREEDEGRPAPRPNHALGEALDLLSVEELRLRIALLHEEIRRLESAVASKQASRTAADAVFKR